MSQTADISRQGNHAKGMGTIDPEAPIDVELYVCEVCRANGVKMVGKLPQGRGTKYAAACTGPSGAPHKQAWMQLRPFKEDVE